MDSMSNENITAGAILNRAALTGLALGLISVAYMFAVQYLPQLIPSAIAVSALTTVLWIAKFVGCILVLRAAMLNFADSFDGVERRHTFRLGVFSAFFSALLFSAASLANVLYISPEAIDEAFDLVMGQYSKILDSNSLAAIDEMRGSIPEFTFFSNLAYCFLYGTVVSSILSRGIPKPDPFAGFRGNGADYDGAGYPDADNDGAGNAGDDDIEEQ